MRYAAARALSLVGALLLPTVFPAGAAQSDDPGCRACLQSASGLFARGDNEGAAKLLSQWQTKCPNNLQLFLMLNTVLMRTQNGKQRALEAAEHACRLAPNSMLPHFQKANTLMMLGQAPAAADEFQRVVELDPTSYEAWLALSELLGAQGKAAEAKSAADHAAQLSPSSRRSLLSTLASKDRAGNIQALKQEVERLAEDPHTSAESLLIVGEEVMKMGYFEACAQALSQARSKYPEAPQVKALLPLALFESGKIAESEKLCHPSSGTTGGAAQEVIYAIDKIASGEYDSGQKIIEKAVAGPSPALTFFAQGYLALHAGRYKEAIEIFSDAQAKNASLTVARIYVALANLEMGDWKEAMSQAKEAQQKASGLKVRAEAIELVARLRDGEDTGTNIGPLKGEITASAPHLSPKDQAIANWALGELALHDKDANHARQLFNSALGQMPGLAQARFGLARAALLEGDNGGATGELTKALSHCPGNVDGLSLLALAQAQSGDAGKADATLAKLPAECELPAATCLALGNAFQKAGDNKKAAQYLKLALQGGLSGALLEQTRATLKTLGAADSKASETTK